MDDDDLYRRYVGHQLTEEEKRYIRRVREEEPDSPLARRIAERKEHRQQFLKDTGLEQFCEGGHPSTHTADVKDPSSTDANQVTPPRRTPGRFMAFLVGIAAAAVLAFTLGRQFPVQPDFERTVAAVQITPATQMGNDQPPVRVQSDGTLILAPGRDFYLQIEPPQDSYLAVAFLSEIESIVWPSADEASWSVPAVKQQMGPFTPPTVSVGRIVIAFADGPPEDILRTMTQEDDGQITLEELEQAYRAAGFRRVSLAERRVIITPDE